MMGKLKGKRKERRKEAFLQVARQLLTTFSFSSDFQRANFEK